MTDTTTLTHELHGTCGDDSTVPVRELWEDDGPLGVWWQHGPGKTSWTLPVDELDADATSVVAPTDHTWLEGSAGSVTLVLVPVTTWGDYVGDSVTRSNHRAILESYADDVVDISWGYNGHAIGLRLDGEIPSSLADEIRGLHEYPLICENTHSTLELELELEDWDSYARGDLRLDVERKLEKLRDGDDVELSWLLTDELCAAPSDGVLLRLVERARQDGSVTWEDETATGGYFRGLEELADVIVAARVERARRWFARFLREEYGETAGQLSI